jgi:hypothetical protein
MNASSVKSRVTYILSHMYVCSTVVRGINATRDQFLLTFNCSVLTELD